MNTHSVETSTVPPVVITNLVDCVTALMYKHAHPRPEDWLKHLNPVAPICTDVKYQQYLINYCWRKLLSLVTEEETLDPRFCLMDKCETPRWLEIFENSVLPCILRNNLPHVAH